MTWLLEKSWQEALQSYFESADFEHLKLNIDGLVESQIEFYPLVEQIFNALNFCAIDDVKIVILGQDPYHGEGQAEGLSFSVPIGQKIPPSLKNIYKELVSDLNINLPQHGNLLKWAQQGVLLLNAILTVLPNKPGSHQNLGWQNFTDQIIRSVSNKNCNVVFMLWGKFAQTKIAKIENTERHLVLCAAHPSPLGAYKGFFGCKHFS